MRNKPRIRFKGFTEDWEQRKLGDLIFLNGRIGFRGYTEADIISKDEGGVLTFSPTNIVDNQITIKCKNTYITRLKYDESPEIKIYNGDILFVKTGSTLGKSALVKDIFEDATLNPQVVVMRPNNLDSEFLSVMMLTDNIASQVRKSRIGGAVPTLTESNIKAFDTLIPKNDEEAQKIGKIFGSLDHVITLHQHKLEKLKLAKKALLQKLFPKNGSQFPKIRFKGFTDAWEQRKLGDIATITGGGTPSTNISEYWNGDIDWYSPVEIGEKRYASGSIRKITKLGLEKSSAKILPVGTVLFTSRAGIGNTAILQVEGCTNQGFQSITPNSKELDTYFLYTMTPKLKRYGEVTGAGSTFVEVSGKQMEQMNLMIPSLDEQKHVSQLFKVMDDAITLHQCKLDKLQDVKKGLLQKMFV